MSEDKPKRFPIPRPGVLLVVALVLVVVAVGLSVWVRYHREQAAIRKIERLGGWVDIGGLFGDEWMKCFDRAYAVDLRGRPISNDDLVHLSGLTNLRFLYLDETLVSADGAKSFRQKLRDCIIVR